MQNTSNKICIYFNHKHIDRPCGGSNNFIKTLHGALRQTGKFEFAQNIEDDYDILFLNEFKISAGNPPAESPQKRLKKIKKISTDLSSSFWKRLLIRNNTRTKKIIVRAVNLKQHSIKPSLRYRFEDNLKIKLVNMADMVIFQSHYQKDFFVKYGYKGKDNVVIHNGADDSIFNNNGTSIWNGSEKLRLVSSTMAVRPTKRHDLIAKVSEYEGVEVSHVGDWPNSIDKKKIEMLGVLEREEVADVLRHSHVFLHPSVKDPCPNVIFEAICCGLPVIYNSEVGSSAEIVKENGIAINVGNVEETIQQIKSRYHELKSNIKQTQAYYSIKRAANEYIKSFNQCLERK